MMRSTLSMAVASFLVAMCANVYAADPAKTDTERLKESFAKWEKLRDKNGGDYSYNVVKTHMMSRETTTIVVRDNKVVERRYAVEIRPPVPNAPNWVEKGKMLGTHKKQGAPARTVDELYAEAVQVTTVPVQAHQRYSLSFDERGVLRHCWIVDTRLPDAEPKGIAPIQIQLGADRQVRPSRSARSI